MATNYGKLTLKKINKLEIKKKNNKQLPTDIF